MTCPKCGAPLPLRGATCAACGADVGIWLSREGQTYGPYTVADLQRAQAEGRIGPQDMVMIGGQGQWVPLAPLLAAQPLPDHTATPPPPVPPPVLVAPRPAARPATSGATVAAMVIVILVGGLVLLSILAAIMFPVFAKAREKARQSSCSSNLKQISLALLQYAQDYDETLPPAPASGVPSGPDAPRAWQDQISRYLRTEAVLTCPSQSPNSYVFSSALYGKRLSEIPDAPSTALVFDRGFDTESSGPHNEGWNVGFVDGHVKWLASKQGVRLSP